jgi:hypothetical protein
MADTGTVIVVIETAIRPVTSATAQVGQKSLQTIIDFNSKKVTQKFTTGVTHLLGRSLHSIRDDFKTGGSQI